ncbi:MAG: glutamate synthase [Clostridia bacterium]|nr:glutamate synthase [Clostridia bacterium]
MVFDARNYDYRALNDQIRETKSCDIKHCIGQRFLAAGMKTQNIRIHGIPGNALGAYLAGAKITCLDNAQDAVGDTMNSGRIVVHGNIGDTAGYAMRGGKIFVKGSAGYRVGIHMKEYHEKKPVIVIGETCGSFLGEYQAGGVLVVLGLHKGKKPLVGNFPCTGMHGGKVFLRGNISNISFPKNVTVHEATAADLKELKPYLTEFCKLFGYTPEEILREPFSVVVPDSHNPYKQMYVAN